MIGKHSKQTQRWEKKVFCGFYPGQYVSLKERGAEVPGRSMEVGTTEEDNLPAWSLAQSLSGSCLAPFFFKPQDHQSTEWYFLQGSGPFHINYQSRKWTHAHRPQANLVTMIAQQSLLFQPSPRCVKMTVNANLDSTPMLLIHTPVTALPFYHCG